MGGVVAEASVRRPELLKVDPYRSDLSIKKIYMANLHFLLGLTERFVSRFKSLSKKRYMAIKEEIFSVYRRLFKYFSDEVLWDYINGGFKEKTKNGN